MFKKVIIRYQVPGTRTGRTRLQTLRVAMELQLVLIFVLNFVTILIQTNFFVTRLIQTEIFVTKLIQTEIFVTYAPEIRSVQIESAFTSFVFTMCFAPLLFQLRARLDLTHVSGTSSEIQHKS